MVSMGLKGEAIEDDTMSMTLAEKNLHFLGLLFHVNSPFRVKCKSIKKLKHNTRMLSISKDIGFRNPCCTIQSLTQLLGHPLNCLPIIPETHLYPRSISLPPPNKSQPPTIHSPHRQQPQYTHLPSFHHLPTPISQHNQINPASNTHSPLPHTQHSQTPI